MTGTTSRAALIEEARVLLSVLETLGDSLDLNPTVDQMLLGLAAVIPCERAAVFLRDRDGVDATSCQRAYEREDGAPALSKLKTKPTPDLEHGPVGEALRKGRALLNEAEGNAASKIVAPIVGGGGRLLGAMISESTPDYDYQEEDLEAVMSFARVAAPSIERAQLHAQLMSDQRVSGELEVARQVMVGLLPNESPRLEGFDISAVIESAYEVGGDYYDFIPLGNDRWGFAMADVSGKGAPAALVVAAMRATLYTLAKRELALRAILQRANEFIHASTGPRSKYVTLFYAVLDTHARRFIYINAGHLPPIVLRRSGDVELLRSGGFPLGFFDNPRYFEQFAQLESGDMLCMYTDGITEATNAHDEEYGRAKLIETLKKHQGATSAEICRAVLSDVRRYSGSAPEDDATLLVISAT